MQNTAPIGVSNTKLGASGRGISRSAGSGRKAWAVPHPSAPVRLRHAVSALAAARGFVSARRGASRGWLFRPVRPRLGVQAEWPVWVFWPVAGAASSPAPPPNPALKRARVVHLASWLGFPARAA